MTQKPTILYTKTDEAPLLATYSLLPILRAFTAPAGIVVELPDISLAGRILANFPEALTEDQRIAVVLKYYGRFRSSEIARIMEITPSTVRYHQREGLRALKKELEP